MAKKTNADKLRFMCDNERLSADKAMERRTGFDQEADLRLAKVSRDGIPGSNVRVRRNQRPGPGLHPLSKPEAREAVLPALSPPHLD